MLKYVSSAQPCGRNPVTPPPPPMAPSEQKQRLNKTKALFHLLLTWGRCCPKRAVTNPNKSRKKKSSQSCSSMSSPPKFFMVPVPQRFGMEVKKMVLNRKYWYRRRDPDEQNDLLMPFQSSASVWVCLLTFMETRQEEAEVFFHLLFTRWFNWCQLWAWKTHWWKCCLWCF